MQFFLKLLFTLAICALLSAQSKAENMQKLGNMNVHYMAIGATFLTPEVAKAYNIQRSKYNGLINISVLDNSKAGNPAKTVSISGTAKNLLGQEKVLAFEEVKEGDAIYYLAQLSYRNEESFTFTINITDGTESQTLTFKQQFYVD